MMWQSLQGLKKDDPVIEKLWNGNQTRLICSVHPIVPDYPVCLGEFVPHFENPTRPVSICTFRDVLEMPLSLENL